MWVPVGPNPRKHSGSLRELGANEPTDGPQKTRKTLESPASGMTQQHEKCLREEWMGWDSLRGFPVPSMKLEP